MQLALIPVVCVALSIAETLVHNPFVTIMDRDRTRYTRPDRVPRGRVHIGSIGIRTVCTRLTYSFVGSLDEPFITALMIGKAAQANERGIEFTVTGWFSSSRPWLDSVGNWTSNQMAARSSR